MQTNNIITEEDKANLVLSEKIVERELKQVFIEASDIYKNIKAKYEELPVPLQKSLKILDAKVKEKARCQDDNMNIDLLFLEDVSDKELKVISKIVNNYEALAIKECSISNLRSQIAFKVEDGELKLKRNRPFKKGIDVAQTKIRLISSLGEIISDCIADRENNSENSNEREIERILNRNKGRTLKDLRNNI
ncbi:MAG: hypothetical protein OIF36_00260 [Alphaproteobacteria bacterium]|jgi:hypothetical protein|nr:hypothetical protein [Alphaproteobacteria bacterium]MCV6598904.1 hypothetical protein [Alphaproteobacteria bacterium]